MPRQSTAIGVGGSHDRHRGSHNGPGKKTELVILEPAMATILGLLYSRIQINSEKHAGNQRYQHNQNLITYFAGFAIHLVKFEIDTISSWPKLHEV